MIKAFCGKYPNIDATSFVAENSDIIGDVTLGKHTSIWFQSVIRADSASILIEDGTNIQDHCTLHCDASYPLHIGKNVTVGHRCIVHGATIEEGSLIGMGAILLNGAHIGKNCLIGAQALVTEGMVIPDHSLVLGSPAKVIRRISEKHLRMMQESAMHYQELAKQYQGEKV